MISRLLGALVALALVLGACASDLTSDLNGRPCDGQPRCLPGCACHEGSNRCLRDDGSTAPRVNCKEGETVCISECVNLASDASNWGGCHTSCSAPPRGTPVCAKNDCNFVCD